MSALHEELIVIDGLIVSNWSADVFRDMRKGGLTAANCTCCVWEGFAETMNNVAQWNGWFREHDDLIVKARTAADIRRAKEEGRTAIVLGFQNTSAFEDKLGAVQLFKDAGVGIAQMTYNTQNYAGSGCYESSDSGLSDWGRELVAEMNRVGMLIDLSHVGSRTSDDTIRESAKPVAYTHCCPSALKPHPRNKSDGELRFIADQGGMIGVTMFPAFLKRGADSTVEDYVEAMEHVISVAGEDHVAFGTDFTQGYGQDFFDWITNDKGDARSLIKFSLMPNPKGVETIGQLPNLTAAMERAGWSEGRIRKVMGENWLSFLAEVWGGVGAQGRSVRVPSRTS